MTHFKPSPHNKMEVSKNKEHMSDRYREQVGGTVIIFIFTGQKNGFWLTLWLYLKPEDKVAVESSCALLRVTP